MTIPKIYIIIGSIRRQRQGHLVAEWVYNLAKQRTDFEIELIDLKDWSLPFIDSGQIPDDEYKSLKQKWSEKITAGDGFIFVTPEYNHGYPASLKNALDLLYAEWNKKPAAFVSYSTGNGAGIRSVEQLRLVSVELQMVPIRETVLLPKTKDGKFDQDAKQARVEKLFDSLSWWAKILKQARVDN